MKDDLIALIGSIDNDDLIEYVYNFLLEAKEIYKPSVDKK